MTRIFRYYVSEIVSKSVANSQMFNWGEVIAEQGIKTKFIIFYRSKERVLKMVEDTNQHCIKIPVVRFFLIRNTIYFFSLLILYLKTRMRYNKILFQSRTPGLSLALALIRILPGVKVITDVRGFELEQYNKKSVYTKLKLLNFDFYTWLSLKASNRIFCVSTPLVKLLTERYKIKKQNKFHIFGGVADGKHFNFNTELRDSIRKEFCLENKTLALYSGMLDKPWQMPEKYFEFFTSVSKLINNLVLVLITPNVSLANKLKDKYQIPDKSIFIKESNYNDLIKYYNMADFGLLFRNNETVNRVAAPTKFSEYSLCGLPVIISNNIGDYSDYIRKTGYGYVIQNTDIIEKESDSIAECISHSNYGRVEIASTSDELFSKQSQLTRLLEIYRSI